MLDTSAYSALHRGHEPILQALRRSTTVAVPAIVLGELYSGFRAGTRWAENTAQLARFLSKPSVRILNVTEETALRYAAVDVYLRRRGRPIPRNDVWIAAVAIEHGLQLLTMDDHFREIPLLLTQPLTGGASAATFNKPRGMPRASAAADRGFDPFMASPKRAPHRLSLIISAWPFTVRIAGSPVSFNFMDVLHGISLKIAQRVDLCGRQPDKSIYRVLRRREFHYF